MKHWMCAAGALALAGTAHAQSSVTLYGLIDTSVRYTTHENANGSGKLQMAEGLLTGSRWGLRADEDLGGGRKAFAQLESGFSPTPAPACRADGCSAAPRWSASRATGAPSRWAASTPWHTT